LLDIEASFNLLDYQEGVNLKIEEGIPFEAIINSDYDKIRQVFTNLVSNAFKYTDKGEIVIGMVKEEDLIKFYVKDTGIGIPEKEREKIFERFYRGSNINSAAIRGTGLGLSIVKELVEMIGGKIWVESNLYPDIHQDRGGKGSTFYFTIPTQ